ncbi:phosphatidylinositol N-acetylglucosaminyltransferase subunit P-like [Ornithodoros turicata]|uniref:phosphatidylinositol N-acetylglucosaminyltransferase subunit P-like n=1 Tax=Ornithodoros turicata TaxID=34597 RepID=UPI003139651E
MAVKTPAPSPIRGIYGYVLYVSCWLGFLLYVIWAYLPSPWLEAVGVTYLPNKYWAIAVPLYVMTAVLVFGTCLYPGYIMLATAPLDSESVLTDRHAVYTYSGKVPKDAIMPVMDLDISDVCKTLYLKR